MRHLTMARFFGFCLGATFITCAGVTLGVGMLMLSRGTVSW